MADFALEWAGDISLDDTGDYATVDGTDELRQRIIRRFMSSAAVSPTAENPQGAKADDVFSPDYGGNARRYIDSTVSLVNSNGVTLASIQKRFLDQVSQEVEVSQTIPPEIDVTMSNGAITVSGIVYLADGTVLPIPSTEVQ